MLNELAPKCSSIHCSIRHLLFSERANGISAGLGGKAVLRRYPHGVFPLLLVTTFCCELRFGELRDSRPKSFKVNSDKLNPDMFY